jgi:hypothetical protein
LEFLLVIDNLQSPITTPIKAIIRLTPDVFKNEIHSSVTLPSVKTGDRLKIPFAIKESELTYSHGWLKHGDVLSGTLCLYGFPAEVAQDDSTEYVGLMNQGATCYLNVLLQSLFHLPAFRRIVYEMPTTGSEDPRTSIPLNLQQLFCKMQLGQQSCSTRALTASFGWGDEQTLTQHDTQEFCRVLMDNLETKMANSPLQGRIASLFRGKYQNYIRCRYIEYGSTTVESFYDLSM